MDSAKGVGHLFGDGLAGGERGDDTVDAAEFEWWWFDCEGVEEVVEGVERLGGGGANEEHSVGGDGRSYSSIEVGRDGWVVAWTDTNV